MFYFWLGAEAWQYHDIEDDGDITLYCTGGFIKC